MLFRSPRSGLNAAGACSSRSAKPPPPRRGGVRERQRSTRSGWRRKRLERARGLNPYASCANPDLTPFALSLSKGRSFLRAAGATTRTTTVLRQAQHERVLGPCASDIGHPSAARSNFQSLRTRLPTIASTRPLRIHPISVAAADRILTGPDVTVGTPIEASGRLPLTIPKSTGSKASSE